MARVAAEVMALRRTVTMLAAALVLPRPLAAARVASEGDPTHRAFRPFCWDALARALAAGPQRLGPLAVSCYGPPLDESDARFKRAAMGQVLARCRAKGLIERVGMGWYALAGDGAPRQGTAGELVALLETDEWTVRRLARRLGVPETRIHHWLMALRRDAAVGPRLRSRRAGAPGWANRRAVYWLRRRGPGRPRARTP